MDFEEDVFGGDVTARRAAVRYLVRDRGEDGTAELIEKILERNYALKQTVIALEQRVYALENP